MSNSGGYESTSSNNSNRVDPRFFGSPRRYNQPESSSKKSDDKSRVMPPPGTGINPYWDENNHSPPPPYSQTPSEPTSPQQHTVDPSAPPLEEESNTTSDYSIGNTGGFIRPQQQQTSSPQFAYQHPTQSSPYPRYGQYGAVVPQNYSPHHTTGDANAAISWPWNTPPSSTGQALLIYPSPTGDYQNYPSQQQQQNKREKSCCEKSFKYFFYFLIICVLLRVLGLISGNTSSFPGSCGYGASWEALPARFTFDHSLVIRVVSGQLTNGHITLRAITDKVREEEGIDEYGLVTTSAIVSPASLVDNPELTYTITKWMNGTVLEIYIPQDLPRKGCINFNAIIYVPVEAVAIDVNVQNSRIEVIDETLQIKDLQLITTNSVINFFPEWSGRDLVLVTKNGHIDINRHLTISNDLIATTTNGFIRAREAINVGNLAYLTTTNGAIDIDKLMEADAFQATSTNGRITINNMTSRAVQLKTTNARIQVDHSNVKELINVQSTNDPVIVHVDRGMVDGELLVRTTNGAASLYMPWDHEGTFDVCTSSHSRVNLIDPVGWSSIHMKDNRLSGSRWAPDTSDHNRKGHTQVVTSNAQALLEFAEGP